MGLQVWLPLNGNIDNQGLTPVTLSVGSPTYTSGKIGQCLNTTLAFNVSNNLITNLGSTNTYSMCCWCKDLNTSAASRWVFSISSGTGTQRGLWENNSSTSRHWAYSGSGVNLSTSINTIDGNWHHICFTSAGSVVKLYVDGIYQSQVTSASTTAMTANIITLNANDYNLNDFRLYDHVLSPREIKEISKGLVLHYPLNRGGFGGDNLLLNSGYFTNLTGWTNNQNVTLSVENNMMKAVINQTTSTPGIKYTTTLSFTAGKTYTFSSIVKKENANNLGYPFYIANLVNTYDKTYLGDGWYKYTYTFTPSSTTSGTFYVLGYNTNNGETWYIKYIKLEEGSVATPWIPNSADPLYAKMGLNGTTEYDVSGYGNNGTKYGTLTYSSDTPRYNTSTVFNGTDNCIQFPFNDFCTNGDIFTMNIWWKKTALGSKAYETLIGGPSGFEMDTRSGAAQTLSLYMATTRGGNAYSPFNMNEWYMVTLVNDGTNELYYVNGTLVKTIEKKNMPSGNYYVGAWKNETGQNFNGFMSDFRFYKTALSADDILELYHTPISLSNNGTLLTQGELLES